MSDEEEQAKRDKAMEALKEWSDQTSAISAELIKANPALHPITASVMANDILSSQHRSQQVAEGADAKDLVWLVGSFARWDWAVAMVAAGKISDTWFDENIADLWRGSDPDDTSAINLSIWKTAARHNKGYVRDGKPLPRATEGLIKVYRGGPPNATLTAGFAWTTDPKIAQKFASGAGERINRSNGVVVGGFVRRGDVLAFLTGRGESEVIVDPYHVRAIKPVSR